ncbi:MAG: DUF4129 domain-containing protein [Burkholderiales bacterium]|nr:DUF4129 domain-containing protein [Burkholderiales bacterium]
MSPPLTYGPAYLGLYAALVLGIVCNAFLDIRYGSFGFETLFWAAVFAYTLRVGWKQQGHADEFGRSRQKIVVIVGGALSVLVFLPVWGLPRGGLFILAALQAAMNCVTTTRRNLRFGLLVSLIMVMFAATHARADWTMLFYLLPYIATVVFTLVSEQISRRAQDIRRDGLGLASAGGQGAAIAAATGVILVLGGLLYAATPQISITHLYWQHGPPGLTGLRPGGGEGGAGSAALPGSGSGEASGGAGVPAFSGLPSIAQMREAARRPGMPGWQSSTITALADVCEGTAEALQPIKLGLDELIENIKQWLKEHLAELLTTLWSLIVLALLIAAWLLVRELRAMLWLRAHFDYLNLGLLSRHAPGSRGVRQYYGAMERLFNLHDLERPSSANTREYLRMVGRRFDHLRREATEATLIFERARYGEVEPQLAELARMRDLYRRMFRQVGQLTAAS